MMQTASETDLRDADLRLVAAVRHQAEALRKWNAAIAAFNAINLEKRAAEAEYRSASRRVDNAVTAVARVTP